MTGKSRVPRAGWYPDPTAGETQRYWDGEQWTGEERYAGLDVALVGAGIFVGAFFPLVGLLIGLALVVRRRPGYGACIMGIAVVTLVFWYATEGVPYYAGLLRALDRV